MRRQKSHRTLLVATVSAIIILYFLFQKRTIYTEQPDEYFENLETRFSRTNHRKDVNGRRSKDAPRIVILWTTWRTGSTFVGELLANAMPNTFYSIEPLHWWGSKIFQRGKDTNAAKKAGSPWWFLNIFQEDTSLQKTYIHSLLHCRLNTTFQEQVSHLSKEPFYLQSNAYFTNSCTPIGACDNPYFVNHKCREANIHIAKIIRLSLKYAWSLMQDEDLDLQIIYLSRDPRPVMLSRSKVWWCHHKSCYDPKTVCNLLEQDMLEAKELQRIFPDKFKFIQYERFSSNIDSELRNLMTFIGLPVSHKQVQLLHPLNVEPDDQYSTRKDSKNQVDRWRLKNDYRYVSSVQKQCSRVLNMLGLRMFSSKREFKNISLPIVVSDSVLFV